MSPSSPDPRDASTGRRLVLAIAAAALVLPASCVGLAYTVVEDALRGSSAAHDAWSGRLAACVGLRERVGEPMREVTWRTVGVGHRSFRRWSAIEVEVEGPRDRVRVHAEAQGLDPADPLGAWIDRRGGLPLVLDDSFCAGGSRWPDASPGGSP